MVPRPACTHPEMAFVVVGNSVFVKCEVCYVRGRIPLKGIGSNEFTLLGARMALEGQGVTAWVTLNCATDGCPKKALRGKRHCSDHLAYEEETR